MEKKSLYQNADNVDEIVANVVENYLSEHRAHSLNNGGLVRINETTRRQKAQQAVNGTSKSIKTYAILTANNPMTEPLPKEYNKRLNNKLMAYLKEGLFVWFPVKGKYDGNENSFIIYNICLSDALHIGEKFEQESIIWCNNETGEKQYWEQDGTGVFKKTHTRKEIVDMADADNYYTQISRKKKFQIPFFDDFDEEAEALNEMIAMHEKVLDETIARKLKRYGKGYNYADRHLKRMVNENKIGRGRWESRGIMFGGYGIVADRMFKDIMKPDSCE